MYLLLSIVQVAGVAQQRISVTCIGRNLVADT